MLYYKFDRDNFRQETFEFQNLATSERFEFLPALFNDTISEINPEDWSQFVVRRRIP